MFYRGVFWYSWIWSLISYGSVTHICSINHCQSSIHFYWSVVHFIDHFTQIFKIVHSLKRVISYCKVLMQCFVLSTVHVYIFSWFITSPIFLADFSSFKKASSPGIVHAIKSMSSAQAKICTVLKKMVPLVWMPESRMTFPKAILKRRQTFWP